MVRIWFISQKSKLWKPLERWRKICPENPAICRSPRWPLYFSLLQDRCNPRHALVCANGKKAPQIPVKTKAARLSSTQGLMARNGNALHANLMVETAALLLFGSLRFKTSPTQIPMPSVKEGCFIGGRWRLTSAKQEGRIKAMPLRATFQRHWHGWLESPKVVANSYKHFPWFPADFWDPISTLKFKRQYCWTTFSKVHDECCMPQPPAIRAQMFKCLWWRVASIRQTLLPRSRIKKCSICFWWEMLKSIGERRNGCQGLRPRRAWWRPSLEPRDICGSSHTSHTTSYIHSLDLHHAVTANITCKAQVPQYLVETCPS